ncbi:protein yellow-like [Pectinophora gossypiella]|uniref:protein yellow-like n=1 Tax=Pectinophora gossypiella TaxID=13191 RepID=UPI00214E6C9A|nr:protein yellow-like [Pectinophora gossypiella]
MTCGKAKMKILLSVVLLSVLAPCLETSQSGLKKVMGTMFRWKQIDFVFPTPQHRQAAIDNGWFIQPNVIPLGVERWKNRVFVSTPAWKKGVPATLSVLPIDAQPDSPLLTPYPNWDWHNAANCTGFTSVFRMNIDHCGVMWVLDSGQVEGFETPRQICPPTLYAIDLATDTVIARNPLPDEFVLQDSLITNILIDSRDARCRDLHVYIADARRFGLIVFRDSDSKFWRFSHYTFYPEPLFSNYTLHGVNFQWADGIFGMSLSKVNQAGERLLYYHSMSSSLEFVVSTSVIRDPARVSDSVDDFKLLGERRGALGQVSAASVDRSGVMFFNLVLQDSIACWDTRKPYKLDNLAIVAQNNNTIVFPNDLRMDHEVPQYAWIITNRLPMYQFNLLNPNEYNFRVMYLDPAAAVEHNVCQPQTSH